MDYNAIFDAQIVFSMFSVPVWHVSIILSGLPYFWAQQDLPGSPCTTPAQVLPSAISLEPWFALGEQYLATKLWQVGALILLQCQCPLMLKVSLLDHACNSSVAATQSPPHRTTQTPASPCFFDTACQVTAAQRSEAYPDVSTKGFWLTLWMNEKKKGIWLSLLTFCFSLQWIIF